MPLRKKGFAARIISAGTITPVCITHQETENKASLLLWLLSLVDLSGQHSVCRVATGRYQKRISFSNSNSDFLIFIIVSLSFKSWC